VYTNFFDNLVVAYFVGHPVGRSGRLRWCYSSWWALVNCASLTVFSTTTTSC